jgi:hypothetical protein
MEIAKCKADTRRTIRLIAKDIGRITATLSCAPRTAHDSAHVR